MNGSYYSSAEIIAMKIEHFHHDGMVQDKEGKCATFHHETIRCLVTLFQQSRRLEKHALADPHVSQMHCTVCLFVRDEQV